MSDDDHDHEEIVQNPEYEGMPGQHCLPPPVKDSVDRALIFAILMGLVAVGGAWLGVILLK